MDITKTGACGTVMNITNNDNLNHKIDVQFGVCEEDCKLMLKEFFKDLRSLKCKGSLVEGEKSEE